MTNKGKLSIVILTSLILCVIACSNDPQIESTLSTLKSSPNQLIVNYTKSSEVFCNPERGFYTYTNFTSNRDENTLLTTRFLKKFREQGVTLIFMTHLMKDFMDKPISEAYLQMIRNNLQALRDGGSKTIIRFAYSERQDPQIYDAPWPIVQNHIQQLKPIFEEYVDVISVLQAGFIGAWGEWYFTTNYIFRPKDDQYGPRKLVMDALLEALPKERMIAVRTPKAKLMMYGINYTDPISISEAYSKTKFARIAAHNDCIFSDEDDMGTFNYNQDYRKYWQTESKYYAMGGESCLLSSYADCENALSILKSYHWSYLHLGFNADVINHWKKNSCFNEIDRNLGYRFVLEEGVFDKQVKRGALYKMHLSLTNVGYAAPYNPRNVEIVIVSKTDPNSKYVVSLEEDPRYWFTDVLIKLEPTIRIPTELRPGQYTLYLNLPDPKTILANRSEFSIRCANDNVWENETGYNKLSTFEIIE